MLALRGSLNCIICLHRGFAVSRMPNRCGWPLVRSTDALRKRRLSGKGVLFHEWCAGQDIVTSLTEELRCPAAGWG